MRTSTILAAVVFSLTLAVRIDVHGQSLKLSAVGTPGNDAILDLKGLPDGGFVVVGVYDSDRDTTIEGFGASDAWAAHYAPDGERRWSRLYGGSNYDEFVDVVATRDGGFVFVGSSISTNGLLNGSHGASDAWIVRVDAHGELLWQRTIGGSVGEGAVGAIETASGDIVVWGSTSSPDGDNSGLITPEQSTQGWIARFAADGTRSWYRLYGGDAEQYLAQVREAPDGRLVFAGTTALPVVPPHGSSDAWFGIVTSSGELVAERTIGGDGAEQAHAIAAHPSGEGWVIAGWTASGSGEVSVGYGGEDGFVAALGVDGSLQWSRSYGAARNDRLVALHSEAGGDLYLAGMSNTAEGMVDGHRGGTDAWLLQLAADGTVLLSRALGGSAGDNAVAFQPSDSGLLAAGYTRSSDGDVVGALGELDGWIVRADRPSDALVGFEPGEFVRYHGGMLVVSPGSRVVLYDLMGRRLLERQLDASASRLALDGLHGVIAYRVIARGRQSTGLVAITE